MDIADNRSFYAHNDNYPYYWVSMQGIDSPTYASYYTNELDTYVHELAHHLGAPDHYHDEVGGECQNLEFCRECNPGNGRMSWCIMDSQGRTASNLLAEDYDETFCPACLNDMKNRMRTQIFD